MRSLGMIVKYTKPDNWIAYDFASIARELMEAKASVLSLSSIPYQRSWAQKLQEIQLKMEVAGTSRIEGAEFTEREFDDAISGESAEEAMTRSQRQARAAVNTYRWLSEMPIDRPISEDFVLDLHRRLVTGCDDDHCEPGRLRADEHNVTFGTPRHRGAQGGRECSSAFSELMNAANTAFKDHDILLQASAIHYHMGAMHPFGDGNGRTARALEAFVLQKAGLRNTLFIALSNYYYDEKEGYLTVLADAGQNGHDLTSFFKFTLTGIKKQCDRLLREINLEIRKALFRDMAYDLFNRMTSTRKRVIAKRQVALLNYTLDTGAVEVDQLFNSLRPLYINLGDPWSAYVRDVINLNDLGALRIQRRNKQDGVIVVVNLDWPQEMSGSEALKKLHNLPRPKTYKFMQRQLGDEINGASQAN